MKSIDRFFGFIKNKGFIDYVAYLICGAYLVLFSKGIFPILPTLFFVVLIGVGLIYGLLSFRWAGLFFSIVSLIILMENFTHRLFGNFFHNVPVEVLMLVLDTNLDEVKSVLYFDKKDILGFFVFLLSLLAFFFNPGAKFNSKIFVCAISPFVLFFLFGTYSPIFKSAKDLYLQKSIIHENSTRIKLRNEFYWDASSMRGEDYKQTVVLFLGETHRGDHLSLNGYYRNTTPQLNNMNIISFSDAISQSYPTLNSTPLIMSRKKITERGILSEKSIISAFKEAGFVTWYISYLKPSHIGDSEINLMASEADYYLVRPVDKSVLEDVLNNSAKKKLIVYKTIGSHFLFHDRYPVEYSKFEPNFKKGKYSVPSISDKEKLMNDYDNSILYSVDKKVSDLINVLESQDGEVSLSFISDHGTSIYDDGHSLYGGNTKGNYSIGLFFWFNDKWINHNKYMFDKLYANKSKKVTSECFLDTMLDIGQIKSKRKGCSLFEEKEIPKERFVRDSKFNIYIYDDIK